MGYIMKKPKILAAVGITALSLLLTACGSSFNEEELPLSSQYIYGTLSSKEKAIYSRMYNGVTNFKHSVRIGNLTDEQFNDFYLKFYCSEADLFYLNSDIRYKMNSDGYVAECYMTYDNFADSTESMREQIDTALDNILSGLNDSMTDAEKLEYLHDYIIDNTTYDAEAYDCDNVYGAVIKHRTHCQGFSKTMCLLCDKLGIPSLLVTGTAGGPHMWNMVQVDGVWYNLDVTWDDPDCGKRKFNYYFLISDSTISVTHTKDTYVNYPAAPVDY